ncbi:hypothetical protein [Halobaculum sp. MBLA0143]|uniref:hypothetical protein n=1 Tax=Halobaculum sp. MBLA0143 TaxID=3079933 RepID=UPI003524DDAC
MGNEKTPGRREVLKSAAVSAAVVGAAGISSAQQSDGDPPVGAGTAGNDRGLPVFADGVLVIEYSKKTVSADERGGSEDQYVIDRTFESDDLFERYGDRRFNYDSLTVSERLVPDAVRSGERSRYRKRAQRVIGTQSEQRQAEKQVWAQEAKTQDVPALSNEVPLYSYESESDAAGGSKQDRTSPLNVAWESRDSKKIQGKMETGQNGPVWLNGTSPFPQINLHVNLPDGGTRSTDKHVMKIIPDLCPLQTKQYHIRLYDVPASGVKAVGQAHRDPCYHGKAPEIPIINPDAATNWKIDQARGAVTNFWEDGHGHHTDKPYVGNTTNDYPSHSGTWAFFDN